MTRAVSDTLRPVMKDARALKTAPHLLAALLFLGWLVAQSPHLVHHLLEGERAQDECALAASADRVTGLSPDIVVLLVEPGWLPRLDAQLTPAPPTRSLPSAEARAPPSVPA
jgi:hypothetical protein